MSRRLTAVVAIALATATLSCGSSKPAGTTPPPPLTKAPTFLAHLGAAHTTLLYLSDPLPHVDRLLASPTVSRLVSHPAIVALRDEGPFDLAAARRTVAGAAGSVPREVAIGVTDTGVQAFGRVMRLAVLFGLVRGSFAAGDAAIERELPALQDLLIAELRATRVPEAVIWVRMRSADDAGRLFDMVSRLADQVPPGVGRVDARADAITVDVDVASMMGGDQLAQMLPFMQLATDPDDPHIPPMVDAIRRFRLHAELRKAGDELELTIGDGAAGARTPAPVAVLQPLFTPGSATMIAWARWDTTSLRALMTEGAALVTTWRDTASGKAMAADDEEDLAGDIIDLDRDLARAPTRGQTRLDAGDSLTLDTIEYDPPAAPPLAADVVALVPADAAAVALDGAGDLGSSMARAMSQVENRMASNWLKKAIGGGDTDAEDAMSAAYYKNFAALRQLVLRDSRDLFLAPAAQVFTTAGKAELTVEVRRGRGKPDREVFHDVPLPEWAVIGRTRDPARALAWAESVYRELVSGALAVGGMKMPAGAKLVVARDLGLGVPTHAFTLDWVGPASGGALSIDVGGDAALHAFARGDLFVISTSPALSRRLLGAGPRLALPSAALVSYGRVTGAAFGDYVERFGGWFATRFGRDEKAKAGFAAVAAAVRALDSIEWQSHDSAATRVSKAELRLAP